MDLPLNDRSVTTDLWASEPQKKKEILMPTSHVITFGQMATSLHLWLIATFAGRMNEKSEGLFFLSVSSIYFQKKELLVKMGFTQYP